MDPYIILSNSNDTLIKKFRVLATGYQPVLEKIGTQRITVTGKLDNQVGPIVRRWKYVLRCYETDPTDPTKSDADTEGYGTLAHLKTFFRYRHPSGTPSNVLYLTDFATSERASPGVCESTNIFGMGTLSWSNPSNAIASDDAYATVTCSNPSGANSVSLYAHSFGFSIGEGTKIAGILAEIELKRSGGVVYDGPAQALVVDGSIVGYRSSGEYWPTADTVRQYGGSQDTWDATLTPEDVNDDAFGIAIHAWLANGATAYVDSVSLVAYYNWAVYMIGSLSEKNLSSHLVDGCAVFDVPIELVGVEPE